LPFINLNKFYKLLNYRSIPIVLKLRVKVLKVEINMLSRLDIILIAGELLHNNIPSYPISFSN